MDDGETTEEAIRERLLPFPLLTIPSIKIEASIYDPSSSKWAVTAVVGIGINHETLSFLNRLAEPEVQAEEFFNHLVFMYLTHWTKIDSWEGVESDEKEESAISTKGKWKKI